MSTQRMLKRIEEYEIQAMRWGDIKTAIKLNWIRNAVRFGDMNLESAAYQLMAVTIWGKFMKEEAVV